MSTLTENFGCPEPRAKEKEEIDTLNEQQQQNETSDQPTLDILINNVVCSFNLRCHLNLRQIALLGCNVEYRRENGMVTMKIRNPHTTASIWSSGKITCTGSTSEDMAKIAARKFARCIQKMGFRVRFTNYRVVNVLGTCSMPFAIRIIQFSEDHKPNASYEPELHPGVTYKIKEPKATLKIFSTGSITVTAPSVQNVQAAIEHIFPIVLQYKKDKVIAVKPPIKSRYSKNYQNNSRKRNYCQMANEDEDEKEDIYSTEEDEEFDSDQSWN